MEGKGSEVSLQSLSVLASTSASVEASSHGCHSFGSEDLVDMSSLCFIDESSSDLTEESGWDIWTCSLIFFTFPAAVDTAMEDTEEIELDVELNGVNLNLNGLLEDVISDASFILLIEGSSEEESEGFDEDKLDSISLSSLRDELIASSLSSLSLKPS